MSAFDRVQDPPLPPGPWANVPLTPAASRGAFWRVVVIVGAVALAVGALVYLLTRDTSTDANLLSRLADVSEAFQPALATSDRTQASDYVAEASGWLIDVPELPGLELVGAGFADLSPQASVPAFRYEGADGETVVVYAYDYVFLDSIRGSLVLGEPVYAALAGETALDTRRSGDGYFVSWRRRAVIYTAVTNDEAVFERIGTPETE